MPSALLCASHTPLMREGNIAPDTELKVAAIFDDLAERVRAYAPDLIVQFAPDHFNGFFYDLMPSFCVGAAATSIGDWGTQPGPLPVPEDIALDLAAAVQADDIDLALSYAMKVDHGTTQIWEEMFGTARQFPVVPIFVNAIAPPVPSYRRARMLGEAVGRYFAQSGRRVLFAASGGLSHDPPIPEMATAEGEARARLIDNRNPTEEARAARQERVRTAGRDAAAGAGTRLPLNPEWDRQVLACLAAGDLLACDRFDTAEVARTAGLAANETLCWIAASAAHAVYGASDTQVLFYEAIPGWIAGMAMLFGTTRNGACPQNQEKQ
ncbi:2,3-dihydroxyphenylpropionate/2,3-dihydroxicinnam ic acid 1,2-dioxygenase [Sphingobium jiangsuense]|uniref:2,3-dihydroxyphenylpropionate 1,2-dioxygenase n=1 Tax=Sphingobium jiangsuense TaxID=870476 RepID=A0A7W6FRT6_9SPHN|nr:3-carboxyethylcatechol 2,3-dioxygenase [Sphingobium jiangsuense]MBB3928380.1 2,3-dihydroxyphenylpropionate 1,2-dioxygenase [Sphingobium jiangsuense]GLS99761.1 2,3-dihydroxyphenylpropionate/2,3-dihydroxicinnam ic acid 1,2-dioxygenase [Sphingobium jiangsuense]